MAKMIKKCSINRSKDGEEGAGEKEVCQRGPP